MTKKYIMFVDETGNPDLNSTEQPFTLTGVIFESKYAVNHDGIISPLNQLISQFKNNCFASSEISLHLDHISRGKGQFKNVPVEQRKTFYSLLPTFLNSLAFTIISVTIDKEKLNTYYSPSKDPYVVAFIQVLTNYFSFINNKNADSARIVIESRDDAQNLIVQQAFFDVFNSGTPHLKVKDTLRTKFKGFIVAKKEDSLYQAGLEIADLVCNPLSRVRRGLIEANPKCMAPGEYGSENKIFKSLKNKIYTNSDSEDIRNWGFQKIPIIKKKRPWVDSPTVNV